MLIQLRPLELSFILFLSAATFLPVCEAVWKGRIPGRENFDPRLADPSGQISCNGPLPDHFDWPKRTNFDPSEATLQQICAKPQYGGSAQYHVGGWCMHLPGERVYSTDQSRVAFDTSYQAQTNPQLGVMRLFGKKLFNNLGNTIRSLQNLCATVYDGGDHTANAGGTCVWSPVYGTTFWPSDEFTPQNSWKSTEWPGSVPLRLWCHMHCHCASEGIPLQIDWEGKGSDVGWMDSHLQINTQNNGFSVTATRIGDSVSVTQVFWQAQPFKGKSYAAGPNMAQAYPTDFPKVIPPPVKNSIIASSNSVAQQTTNLAFPVGANNGGPDTCGVTCKGQQDCGSARVAGQESCRCVVTRTSNLVSDLSSSVGRVAQCLVISGLVGTQRRQFPVPDDGVRTEAGKITRCQQGQASSLRVSASEFKKLVDQFCASAPLSKDISRSFETPGDIQVSLQFVKAEGDCTQISCDETLNGLAHSCNIGNTIQGHGTSALGNCGYFSFAVLNTSRDIVGYSAAFPARRWAALGDSFAAGIGAGNVENLEDEDSSCARYDHSYARQWNQDMRIPLSSHHFQHEACTGAIVSDVYKQLAKLNGSEDLITLTIGGNDIEFASILDRCIFRWSNGYAGECDQAFFQQTVDLIADGHLLQSLKRLLSTILLKYPSPDFTLFVTGYAEFFNALTPQCSNVSFTYWTTLDSSPNYLTQPHRAQLNALVRLLNQVISRAVQETPSNGTLRFVNYSPDFEGHRFCEPGVSEPDSDRPGLWFFNYYTVDAMPPPILPPGGKPGPGTPGGGSGWPGGRLPDGGRRPGYGPPTKKKRKGKNPLASKIEGWIEMAKGKRPELRDDMVRTQSGIGFGWLPDSYVRVFHPRVLGHWGIMEKIREVDQERKGARNRLNGDHCD
ncbi:MAG: hypothetical protein M1814_003135 [Vezdaea aestivalis]|nr:MAG: hypothetical protein M1814_003135 [Vezdaea aestivalis]